MVFIKHLLNLYQSDREGNLDIDLLLKVASEINEACQNMPGVYDENDRDAGKDAYNFFCRYPELVSSQNWPKLMIEIDILLHGCHTSDKDIIGSYVRGASRSLLDFIYEWDGKGKSMYYDWVNRAF